MNNPFSTYSKIYKKHLTSVSVILSTTVFHYYQIKSEDCFLTLKCRQILLYKQNIPSAEKMLINSVENTGNICENYVNNMSTDFNNFFLLLSKICIISITY